MSDIILRFPTLVIFDNTTLQKQIDNLNNSVNEINNQLTGLETILQSI